MAHQHLHFHEDFNTEQTRDKQLRVSIALIGTLAGGVLLINSGLARYIYRADSFNAELFAMLGAILLGAPIIVHAVKSLIRGESHMDELAALGIVAAFATGEYVAAGLIGFFMLLSELVETRTALGARASIESLIRLTPKRANLVGEDGLEREVKVSELRP
ncbi:MAG: cation-translocating P-type ATPase, partial [Planctomycetes bacterium]|nr:cation-translocating P-type ATPase [Planctomycetota bacterium]